MTTQTVTALELTAERPEMVKSIIELIMADTVANLVDDEKYSYLRPLLIQPREDIVENYKSITASLFLFEEYRQLLPLVDQLLNNIGAELFCDMWETNQSHALSEVLRCFGHGVSFWDNWDCKLFGLKEDPKLKTTLEQPYVIASQILDKIAERQIAEEDLDNEIMEEDKFDEWLSENYEHSGGEYYLSKNPNDYLMYEWYTLKQQYFKGLENDPTIFRVPEIYLSLIFNGDESGLEEEDIQQWDNFCHRLTDDGFTNGHWSYPEDCESYFSWSNDVHNSGANVVDLQWVEMST